MKYDCNNEIEINAPTAEDAAQEYVDGGDWGDNQTKTFWVRVYTTPVRRGKLVEEERERHTITVDPSPPECAEGEDEHDWRQSYTLFGGLEQNPGVRGHGGGVVIQEACAHCGAVKITDTWAQNPETGEQGLTSIEYVDADDETRAWANWMRVYREHGISFQDAKKWMDAYSDEDAISHIKAGRSLKEAEEMDRGEDCALPD
jgi:hypothetical protein